MDILVTVLACWLVNGTPECSTVETTAEPQSVELVVEVLRGELFASGAAVVLTKLGSGWEI